MDWTLEVVILPVSDIERSVAFYRDQVGFDLDHDTKTEQMHVVQLTPRGSGCSIVFGDLPTQREMAPGSIKGLQLCVADAAARATSSRVGASSAARSWSSRPTTVAPSSASPTRTATPGRSSSSWSGARSRSSPSNIAAGSAPNPDIPDRSRD
jgi:predicted enzyme related to lactoylglutathione lyase